MKKKNLLMTAFAIFGFATITSAQLPSYVPTNGLVGWWPFNGNANDESGNGNNGTVNGATLTTDRNGVANKAYNFDGVSNFIDIGNPASLANNPQNYTQTVWAQYQYFPTTLVYNLYPLISKRHQNNGNDWATPYLNPNGKIVFVADDAFYENSTPAYSNILNIGQWYHFTFVKSSSFYSIYVDGILINSSFDNHVMGGSTDNLLIGAQLAWNQYNKGKLDDIGIWNRALTQQEITNLYYGCQLAVNSLPDTTLAFKQDSILLNAGAGYSKYVWSRGDTTQSIWVKSAGMNKVTVFNSLGCSSIDSTNVIFVKGIQQKDTLICSGKSLNLSIPSSGSIIPNNGLVAWYPLSSDALDYSGNGYNLSSTGTILPDTNRFGFPNNAKYFGSSTPEKKYNLPLNAMSAFNNLTSGTVSFWLKIKQLNVTSHYFGFDNIFVVKQKDGVNTQLCIGLKGGTSKIRFHLDGSLPASNIFESTTSLNTKQWYHVAVSWNGAFQNIYINGILNNSIPSNQILSNLNSPSYFSIGSAIGQGSNGAFSVISDTRFYNRELASFEIQALYSGGTNSSTKVTWSTSDTTSSINVIPTTSTTYRCTQQIGSFTMTDSVLVTVNALPIINSLPDTTITFKQDSIILNVGAGYSKYLWSRGDTTQSILVKTAGMNKVTVFNSTGCINSDSTNVIFVKGILNKDSSVCKNTFVNLKTLNQVNAKYLWSTGDTISNINKQIVSDTLIKCTYQIGSFVKQDSVKLIVRNLPSKTITYNKKGLCKNDTISINVLTGYDYNWYKNNNIIAGTNNTLKAFESGYYKAKLTDSTGCISMSDSVILINAPLPKVNMIINDTALCVNGNMFKYTDSTIIDSGTYNRIWTFGNGNTSILSTSNQSYTSAGNYVVKLKVITNYGCADSVIKNIIVEPNPLVGLMLGQVINLIPSTPYIYNVTQQLNHTYNWTITNGIIVSGQGTNSIIVQWASGGAGKLKVEIKNPHGCIDTNSLNVAITSTGIKELSNQFDFQIYPNPNNGNFTIQLKNTTDKNVTVTIVDMLGRAVSETPYKLSGNEDIISISDMHLQAGTYNMIIGNKDGVTSRKSFVLIGD